MTPLRSLSGPAERTIWPGSGARRTSVKDIGWVMVDARRAFAEKTFTILPFQKPCNASLPCIEVSVSFLVGSFQVEIRAEAKGHVCSDIFHRSSVSADCTFLTMLGNNSMEAQIIATRHSHTTAWFLSLFVFAFNLDIEDYPFVACLRLHQPY